MKRDDEAPLKVFASTKERIRLGAVMEGCTMGEFTGRAVEFFLNEHRAEIEAGIAHTREVLAVGETKP